MFLEMGAAMRDEEGGGHFYRKGLKIDWKDPEKVREYRRAWWRLRHGKVAQTRRELRKKWATEHGLPGDRVRAMREFARIEARRRGCDAMTVYREWGCMTPREKERWGR